jgi:hypothetical protein
MLGQGILILYNLTNTYGNGINVEENPPAEKTEPEIEQEKKDKKVRIGFAVGLTTMGGAMGALHEDDSKQPVFVENKNAQVATAEPVAHNVAGVSIPKYDGKTPMHVTVEKEAMDPIKLESQEPIIVKLSEKPIYVKPTLR